MTVVGGGMNMVYMSRELHLHLIFAIGSAFWNLWYASVASFQTGSRVLGRLCAVAARWTTVNTPARPIIAAIEPKRAVFFGIACRKPLRPVCFGITILSP